ncbi:unnamed protein product [Phyllotreta striolata]|uniref:Apyrase n=1 Tax=Phyllotreta striolata TaxID=444603 RepID=A0A9N9TTS6_PHYSR|nr:unnamed protein product [Phyllotreta striolata]
MVRIELLVLVICPVGLICVSGIPRQTKPTPAGAFELSVVHFNDFHARFEETNIYANTCKPDEESSCIGGFSRLYEQIAAILDDKPKSILLNAGDSFQGTLWYNIGKWNVTQEFMNKLPIDAEVIGNHEFDDGIAGLVPYIKALKHPVVVSNIDDSQEPSFQGIYAKSTVVERDGRRIGVVGVITSVCDEIASTGRLKFFGESASVNAEAERLVREEGVFTVIVLSHSGYDVDKEIAANASEKISLIVGGHSHTFLYTGDNPPGPDKVGGPYPTIVQSKFGHDVLVTQASAYSKYLGNITIYLDDGGEIVDYSGAPIFLAHDVPQDQSINKALEPWKKIIHAEGDKVIGSSLVSLDDSTCYTSECTLGNLIADAYVFAYTKSPPNGSWTEAAIGLINAGGLRSPIEKGNISYSDLLTAQPFGNTIDFGQIQGKYLKEAFEETAKEHAYGRLYSSINLLQVSGVQLAYDLSKPLGERVVSIKVRCADCTTPAYEDLDQNKSYNVVMPSFLSQGGDNYVMFKDQLRNKRVGPIDVDILVDYLGHYSPVFEEISGRIVIDQGENELVYYKR